MRPLPPGPHDGADLLEVCGAAPTSGWRASFVVTPDGTAAAGGTSDPLSGPGDRAVFRALRAAADVVLVGARTATDPRYARIPLGAASRSWRRRAGRADAVGVAVVSGDLSLPADAAVLHGPVPAVVYTSTRADARRRVAVAQVADLVVAGRERVDLAAVRADLVGRGLGRVLCEGGPALLSSALAAGVVDELCLTVSPRLLGGAVRLLPGPLAQEVRLRLLGVLSDGDEVALHYAVDRPR